MGRRYEDPLADPVEVSATTIIAFAGDHGTKPASLAVFELIAREGADLLVSQGDLGYDSSPAAFDALLNETLSPDFPIVAALGNHDWPDRSTYSAVLRRRLARVPDVECEGASGLESTCRFRGIEIISVTPALPRLRLPWRQSRYLETTRRSGLCVTNTHAAGV